MPEKPRDKKKRPNAGRQIGLAMMIPMTLAAGPLVGWFIGDWIDHRFNIAPWGINIMVIFGFIAGITQTWKIIKEISRD